MLSARSQRRHLSERCLSLTVGAALVLAPLSDAAASPSGAKTQHLLILSPEESQDPEPVSTGEELTAELPAVEDEPVADEPIEDAALGPQPDNDDEDNEPPKGLGMMIPGAVITGVVGIPFTALGTTLVIAATTGSNEGDATYIIGLGGGFALAFGIAGLAVGGSLLGVGAARFSRYRKWKAANNTQLSMAVGRTRFGTITPGLTLRF